MNCARDSADGQRSDLALVNALMPLPKLKTIRLTSAAARFSRELRRCMSAFCDWDKGHEDSVSDDRHDTVQKV